MAPPRDIATGIAATVLIFVAVFRLTIIGFFCSFLLPLPVLFYRVKLGRKPAAIIAGVSAAVMAAMIGAAGVDLLFCWWLLGVGLVLGEFYEKGLSAEQTLLRTSAFALAAAAGALLVFSAAAGRGPVGLVSDYVAENLQVTLEIYRQRGVPSDIVDQIKGSLDQIRHALVRVLPSMAAAGSLLISWACLLISRALFRARNIPVPDFGPLNRWRSPEPLVWAVIGCGVLLLLPISGLKVIGLNGLIVLMAIYFFQGIAIVSFFFQKKRLPMALRFILYSLIALQQFLLLLIIGFGFFDMWLNFRKLGSQENG